MKTLTSFYREKTDAVFLAAILLSLFLFYPELFIARIAMLTGDHAIQHYPWAVLLSDSLKHFHLPFWTSAIHCGFPITAEGQIGSFYPPNWLWMGPLPPQWGYSYSHVFHFLVAGWGLYGYARVIKLSPLASFFAAFVYLFGTVYGGAYYNITSLKTLAWFPWLLFCFERFTITNQKRLIVFIALAAAFSVLAGYLQVAVYGLGMFVVYVLLRLWVIPEGLPKSFQGRMVLNGWVFAGLAIGSVLTLPQLILTYELAMRSSRVVSVEEYAYIGSMFPGALATFFYPILQGLFRGNSLYLGMTAVWLVPIGFFCREVRKNSFFRMWTLFAFLSVLLALGEWSPLYVFLVKISHFYSFRTPAKFLFFICFSLSILAGIGLERLSQDIRRGEISLPIRRSSQLYIALVAAALLGVVFLLIVLTTLGPSVIQDWGYAFVERSFLGKIGHPNSLEVYHQKWDALIETILRTLSPVNPWNAAVFGVMFLGGLIAVIPLRAKKIGRFFLPLLLFFTAADLYLFSWNDIRRDFSAYAALGKSPLIQNLIQEKKAGGIGRIYGFRTPEELLPMVPSENMLYGMKDVGAYSPFVTRRYLETVGRLGNVDDSNGLLTPTTALVERNSALLNFMDISHLLSTQPLQLEGWMLLAEERGSAHYYLYQNKNPHAKAHFISNVELFETWPELREKWMGEGYDPASAVYLEKSEWQKLGDLKLPAAEFSAVAARNGATLVLRQKSDEDEEVWSVTADRPGFFVRTTLYEPRWICKLNGRQTPVLAAYGIFQAVWIPSAGTYEAEFSYRPFMKSLRTE